MILYFVIWKKNPHKNIVQYLLKDAKLLEKFSKKDNEIKKADDFWRCK